LKLTEARNKSGQVLQLKDLIHSGRKKFLNILPFCLLFLFMGFLQILFEDIALFMYNFILAGLFFTNIPKSLPFAFCPKNQHPE
jgi:hypothetical protein